MCRCDRTGPLSKRLFKSTVLVGANTFGSRVLGLVRDVILLRLLGASAEADAFLVAFRIPNFLRRLFAEGAFSQAFVPVISEYKSQRSEAEVRDLCAHVSGTLLVTLFAVGITGVLAAPVLVMVFAPGFTATDAKFDLTVEMLRITFPYIFFISLTAFAGGVMNTYGRFGVPAFTPVLLNLSLISAALWLSPYMEQPAVALAWGVFIAGAAQLVFQFPFLWRLRMLVVPRFKRAHEGVRKILRLIGPAIFGVSVSQINLLIDTVIASFLITGSVTWLYSSDRLVEFPLGVFGIALATVILPSLSQRHAEGSTEVFSATLDWALRWGLLIALPAATGLAVLAEPILATVFERGEFGARDVEMAGRSLAAYAFGLLGFVAIKILAPGYFSRHDMRTPVRIGVIAMIANMVFNVILVFPLAHAGLALATTLSALINAGLLYRGLLREGVYRPRAGWRSFLVRVVVANVLMAVILWYLRGDLSAWLLVAEWSRAFRLAGLVFVGAGVYFVTLVLCGLRPRSLIAPAAERAG